MTPEGKVSIGDAFGLLVVRRFVGRTPVYRKHVWIAVCACGRSESGEKMAATPESAVKRDVHKYLNSIGCIRAGTAESNWPENPRGWYYMPMKGVAMGVNGIPDFVGHVDGKFFSIETKAPGKISNVSANQERRILEITTSGGIAVVIDDVSQLEEVLT